jgi:hypothetical protein
MELLIPGLILVGLMVYASTRIKRSAAKAFEAENVETEEFTLYKPDGFLNVINGDPDLAFEAYSKDFGTGDDNNVRAARAKIRVLDGGDLDKAVANVKESVRVVSELSEVIGEAKCRLIEAETEEDGKAFAAHYKLISAGHKTYEMQVLALKETSDEVARNIERMVDSFSLK